MKEEMIVVVDSGVANLASVITALGRLGVEAIVTSDPMTVRRASRVILPGVGSAPVAMQALIDRGLVDTIRNLTQPVLGICLGMQLLFESSTEGGQETSCLGIMPGVVDIMPAQKGFPIPHMGWNTLTIHERHPLLHGVVDGDYVYYVHSYGVDVHGFTIASTSYTKPFTAIASQRNFMGCQFHPERSGPVGAMILRNFLEMDDANFPGN